MSKWLKYAREEYAGGHYGRAAFYAKMSVAEDQKRAADAQERAADAQARIALAAEWFVFGLNEAPDEKSVKWFVNMLQIINEIMEGRNKNG